MGSKAAKTMPVKTTSGAKPREYVMTFLKRSPHKKVPKSMTKFILAPDPKQTQFRAAKRACRKSITAQACRSFAATLAARKAVDKAIVEANKNGDKVLDYKELGKAIEGARKIFIKMYARFMREARIAKQFAKRTR
jgi:hypothetical protein